jgi:iron(III) transport system permease protein
MAGSRRKLRGYIPAGICVAVLGAFLVWPAALTLGRGFFDTQGELTLRYVADVFRDPVLLRGLINSGIIATLVTMLSLVMALPLAVLGARYEFRGKAVVTSLLLLPLILPPFVGAIGLQQILGRYGSVNAVLMEAGLVEASNPLDILGGARLWGVVIMEALHLYPILYLNLAAALANVDPALEQAAENLGASRWRRFRRITWPLIMPGVFAGATIVFIWSFTELGTPLMFEFYDVTAVQIFWGIQEIESPRPYALVAVMLAVALGLYGFGRWVARRGGGGGAGGHGAVTRGMVAGAAKRLRGWRGMAAAGAFVVITAMAVVPHVGVVVASFAEPGAWYRSVVPKALTTDHYTGIVTHELAAGAIRNSLVYATGAMIVAVVLGLTIAWVVVRQRVRGAAVIDAMAMLPLAVPGLVLAFGYVAMSLHWPFPQLAAWLDERGMTGLSSMMQIKGQSPDPLLFLVVAYAIRRLPYVVRAAAAGLEQTSGDLEEAARNLGASWWRTMRRIVVPLIAANLIAGALLAFSFAMLEVSDSLILAETERDYPITKAIYSLFQRLGDGPYIASAMGVWGMTLLGVTLVTASVMLGRRLGAIFRI